MKQVYTILLLTLVTIAAYSRPVNTVTTWYGNWSDASSWSLGRVPQDGDSVVVAAGKAIVVDATTSLSNLYINVPGTLTIKKMLTLDNASTIRIAAGGQINRWAADVKKEIIVLGGVDKFDQTNASSINGLAIASSATGMAPAGFSVNSALPVTFASFYAAKNNNDVVLTWSTAQELNNNNFEIQRSADGSNWNVIAVVMGMGTTNTLTQYSYTDKNNTAATAYYRIRQVDFDGNFEFSTVKSIHGSEATPVTKVYAASNNNINIEFNKAIAGNITVRVLNTNGQLLAQQNFVQAAERITMNNNGKGAGLYVIQVSDGKGWSESTKLFL